MQTLQHKTVWLWVAIGMGILNLLLVSLALTGISDITERMGAVEKATLKVADGVQKFIASSSMLHVEQRLGTVEKYVDQMTYRIRALTSKSSTSGNHLTRHFKEIVSEPFHINQIYKSMLGPFHNIRVKLKDKGEPELMWLTGYKVEVVSIDGKKPLSEEFFCHANLDIGDVSSYINQHSGSSQRIDRLFTLTQGQQEVHLPKGFGIPILSNQELVMGTQALNLNKPKIDIQVRHKIKLWYMKDQEVTEPIQPLYQSAIQGLKSLDGARYFGLDDNLASQKEHGPGCDIGKSPLATSMHELSDPLGHKFSGHWEVKPGREVNRTNVTRWLGLLHNTTIHFIGVHVHPYAESMELVDLTDQKTLFRAKIRSPKDRKGLEYIDTLSSAEGIPIYKDHEYEIVSVYVNPTSDNSDAMASMFLYLHDSHFHKPFLLTRL